MVRAGTGWDGLGRAGTDWDGFGWHELGWAGKGLEGQDGVGRARTGWDGLGTDLKNYIQFGNHSLSQPVPTRPSPYHRVSARPTPS
jgi:hypothetical protein